RNPHEIPLQSGQSLSGLPHRAWNFSPRSGSSALPRSGGPSESAPSGGGLSPPARLSRKRRPALFPSVLRPGLKGPLFSGRLLPAYNLLSVRAPAGREAPLRVRRAENLGPLWPEVYRSAFLAGASFGGSAFTFSLCSRMACKIDGFF